MESQSENNNPNTVQQYMSYLSSDERQNLGLHFVVLEIISSIFGEAKGFNLVEPA
jgi:hypothetical protein